MLRYFFSVDRTTPFDKEIDVILKEMRRIGVNSEEYPKMMTHLERLSELKVKERQEPVSRDTIALIIGNLVGIVLIVAYEQKHVITSQKGFNQLIRPR